tara:strand:+ start:228 stop:512 length:285 start_codon:yes stop_codon:yes gene_type:complete
MRTYNNRPWTEEDLTIGMMVQDISSGDVGILAQRYNVMKEWREELPIWAWELMWTGPSTDPTNRLVPFTEFGILGLLNSGRWAIVDEASNDVKV